jgi:hypothetical protein
MMSEWQEVGLVMEENIEYKLAFMSDICGF